MFIEHCISQKLPSFCGVRRDQFFIQKRLKNTNRKADDGIITSRQSQQHMWPNDGGPVRPGFCVIKSILNMVIMV